MELSEQRDASGKEQARVNGIRREKLESNCSKRMKALRAGQ
jgi:hypothetical protein